MGRCRDVPSERLYKTSDKWKVCVMVAEVPRLAAANRPLALPKKDLQVLLEELGPSLALWRAAEIAALREQSYRAPVLDVGCGDGIVTSRVLATVDSGLDPDRRALAHAANLGNYRQLIQANIEDAPLPLACMSTVMSNSVLEHLPHIDNALQGVSRLLRPGGKFIFTAPTETFARWLALPSTRYAAWRNRQLGHVNLWPTQRWADHLERVGLEITETRCYLRRRWVMVWDALELAQMLWLGRQRLAGILWKRLSSDWLDRLAQWASTLDLGAEAEGGGRLIVARKL